MLFLFEALYLFHLAAELATPAQHNPVVQGQCLSALAFCLRLLSSLMWQAHSHRTCHEADQLNLHGVAQMHSAG